MAAALNDVDSEYLISAVEQKPEIWDTSNEHFRNKELKERAWTEIAADFIQNCIQFENEEITALIAKLQKRWRAIRDAFKRTRSKGGVVPKKQAKFHENLKFLEKNMDLSSTEYYIETDQTLREVLEQSDVEEEEFHLQIQPKADTSDRRKSTKKFIFEESPVKNCVAKYDGDRSFLESLLPTLQTFNEEQKLQFRIEVLNALQKVKNMVPQPTPPSRGPLKSYVLTTDGELKEEKKRPPTTAAERMRKMRERRRLEAGLSSRASTTKASQQPIKAELASTSTSFCGDTPEANDNLPSAKKIKKDENSTTRDAGSVDSVILIWTELLGFKLQQFDIITREILMNDTDNNFFKAKIRMMKKNSNQGTEEANTPGNSYPMEVRYVDISSMNVTQSQDQMINATPLSTTATPSRTRVVNKCEIVYVNPEEQM